MIICVKSQRSIPYTIVSGRITISQLIVVFLILSCSNFINATASVPLKAADPGKIKLEEKSKNGNTATNQSVVKAHPITKIESKKEKTAVEPDGKHDPAKEAALVKATEISPPKSANSSAESQKPEIQVPRQPIQSGMSATGTNQTQANQNSKAVVSTAVPNEQDKSKTAQKKDTVSSNVPLQEKAKGEITNGDVDGKQPDVRSSPSSNEIETAKKNSQAVVQPSVKIEPVKNSVPKQDPQKDAATPPQISEQKKDFPGQLISPDPNATGLNQGQSDQNAKIELRPAGPVVGQGESEHVRPLLSSGEKANQVSAIKGPNVSLTIQPSNEIKPGTSPSSPQPAAGTSKDLIIRPISPAEVKPNQPPAPNQTQRIFQLPHRPQQGKVTLNFDDADIYSVIQTVFGEILRVSYTVDPKIKGRVTFRAVAPVEIDKVLPLMEVIFRLNGIAIVEENGLNRIVPLSDIAREPVPVSFGRTIDAVTGKSILKVVPIKNMQSAEMVKLLTPFSSEKAVIVNVSNTNQIIIVDTDSTVKRLIQLVDIFDTELQKPRGARVYVHHIQNGSAREITELLQKLFLGASITDKSHPKLAIPQPQIPGMISPKAGGAPGSVPPTHSLTRGMDAVLEQARIVADENANTVIVYATPEEYEAIKDAIEKIDITPRQVLIEALILDVLLTDNLSLGVNAAFKSKDLRIGFNAASSSSTDDNVNSKLSAVAKGLSILKLAGNSDLSLFITALAEKSKLKVLSAPHTIVSDSKEAEITIADTVQITSADIVGTTTVQNTTLYQQKDVGTILKVIPRIHEGGMVALKISQEVSQVAGDISDVKQGTLFHKTQVRNELVAMDGETIIIGGLIREDLTRSRNGIPFLSSIPLLGWLFGGTTDNVQRRELIILLTPRVIKNQNDASRITEEYINRLIQGTKTGMTRDDIINQLPITKPEVPDISQKRMDSRQQK